MRLPKVVGVRHGRLERLITKKSFVKHLHEGTVGHIVETSNDEAYVRENGGLGGPLGDLQEPLLESEPQSPSQEE